MQARPDETMKAERWARVKTILSQALECETKEDRTAFLQESCEGDTALLREIEALLARTPGPWEECAEKSATFVSRDALPEMAGRRIGAYEIVREIGRGGMGAVYLA